MRKAPSATFADGTFIFCTIKYKLYTAQILVVDNIFLMYLLLTKAKFI